jgi:hypothetical protein
MGKLGMLRMRMMGGSMTACLVTGLPVVLRVWGRITRELCREMRSMNRTQTSIVLERVGGMGRVRMGMSRSPETSIRKMMGSSWILKIQNTRGCMVTILMGQKSRGRKGRETQKRGAISTVGTALNSSRAVSRMGQ